jgi:type VI protein secretion system component VasK
MATDGPSRLRVAVILLIVVALLLPVVTSWLDLVDVPAVETGTLVRLAGLAVLAVVLGLLVFQKRRARGQRASEDAPEQSTDRRIEGSGEVYAPQQEAKREADRIQERTDLIGESERDTSDDDRTRYDNRTG